MATARPGAGLPEGWDVLVAAVLAVVVTARLAFVLDDARMAGLPGWAFGVSHLLALADLATIAFRRSHAVPALVAATVIPLVSMLLPTRSALIGVGVLICSYTVASRLPQVRATVVVSACAAGHMLGGLLLSAAGADHGGLLTFWGVARGDVPGMVAAVTAAYLLPATLGFSVRSRRAAKAREAARIAGEQEERARAAVAEERARIARELHDIAAHDLSAIVVQAGAADRLLDRDPAAARATLRAIRAQGRDTLVSMRALVGIMRESEIGTDLDSAGGRAPTLAGLEETVRRSRTTGMDVELRATGEPRTLPVTVDLAASRLVREALVNARRHSPGASVSVTTAFGDAEFVVAVRNSSPARTPPPAEPNGGHGLLGMRERVNHAGGELTIGPQPDGGWLVSATFPLERP